MSFAEQCVAQYAEQHKLHLRIKEIETLATSLEQEIARKDRTIIELQSQLRHVLLTRFCDLDPADLDLPDPLFAEAAASGLYELKRVQLVHLLLRKEQVIQQLTEQYMRLKRDWLRLHTYFITTTRPRATTPSSPPRPQGGMAKVSCLTESDVLALVRTWGAKEKHYLGVIQRLKAQFKNEKN